MALLVLFMAIVRLSAKSVFVIAGKSELLYDTDAKNGLQLYSTDLSLYLLSGSIKYDKYEIPDKMIF